MAPVLLPPQADRTRAVEAIKLVIATVLLTAAQPYHRPTAPPAAMAGELQNVDAQFNENRRRKELDAPS